MSKPNYPYKYKRELIRDASILNEIPQEILDTIIYPMIATHNESDREYAYSRILHSIELEPIRQLINQLPNDAEIIEHECHYDENIFDDELFGDENVLLSHSHEITIRANLRDEEQIDDIFAPVSRQIIQLRPRHPLQDDVYILSHQYSPSVDVEITVKYQ